MNKGKVWLVGAGPGDAGLLTVKGKKILEEAEVIVYDALVGDAICSAFPNRAELVYVGKRDSRHTMKQEEINALLVAYAMQGKRVVRLKGGDPFLFGRGGEEVEELIHAGISFEIVPGVPSALAVPAYNGIPVTHRDYSSSIHIITGHKKKNEPLNIDFDALYRTKGTYIFLMGVSTLPEICAGFQKAGMDSGTPAALLSRGTTAYQQRVVGTVGTLEDIVKEAHVERPAILVIGNVCGLAEKFSWYEKLLLSGSKIVVTRPEGRSKSLAEKLRRLGAEVLEIPTIRTEPVKEQGEWEKALCEVNRFRWLVFTSPAGVEFFFEKMRTMRMDVRSLTGVKLAAIGPGTAAQLEKRGLLVDLLPEKYDGKSLGQALADAVQTQDRILIPRARIGNQELIREIRAKRDVTIVDLPIYETLLPENFRMEKQIQEFADRKEMVAVFTSASTVRGFAALAEGMDLEKVQAVCIGAQTKAAADKYGMQTSMAKEATEDSLVEAVLERVKNMK